MNLSQYKNLGDALARDGMVFEDLCHPEGKRYIREAHSLNMNLNKPIPQSYTGNEPIASTRARTLDYIVNDFLEHDIGSIDGKLTVNTKTDTVFSNSDGIEVKTHFEDEEIHYVVKKHGKTIFDEKLSVRGLPDKKAATYIYNFMDYCYRHSK
ncbi:MAG: hypothetical protein LBH25_11095 [Fibromonadaceae bacterium]|jgi:hypothetical protein|nr:hypothetical protein [Fibromonadaceae bacterium]